MSLDQFLQDLSSEEGLTFLQSDFTSFISCFNSIKTVTQAILNPEKSMLHLVNIISKFIHYDDLKYYILKSLLHWLKVKRAQNSFVTDIYLMNAYNLLTSIQLVLPGKNPRKRKLDTEMIDALNAKNSSKIFFPLKSDEDKLRSAMMYEKMADVFASVWLTFISFKIPQSLYINILKIMDTRIMPYFRNPLTLSDFLVQSYDFGGSASLLALSSLFILIQKCNLEYPNFYPKLYSMMIPDMLHVKYRARFFFWSEVFLSSSHLPSYLVASFVKRLSRLALTAPLDALLIILPFIQNLLIQHPNLKSMCDHTSNLTIASDPFDNEEEDLIKTRALESSLWEVKSLQNHWDERVCKAAVFINKPLPKKEIDLSELLELNLEELSQESYESIDQAENDVQVDQDSSRRLKEILF